ncbi:MAG: hypothetical protein IPK93_06120 [Solirubrobacterales bacterium]|nr:hypothetical protein [Solirubrobacterales bacterium]
MKLRDNGAYSGADDARGEPIFSDEFLVDSIPVADDKFDTHLESDETTGITLPASDADVYPLKNINDDQDMTITITDPPDHGSVTVPDSNKAVTYDPDNTFSGWDYFTYQADDGYGGIDTGVVGVRVDPATDWESVPSTTTDIDARSVAPEFSSPTEGFTLTKFECSLDFTVWYDCVSGDAINDLEDGSHNFRVRANGGDSTIDPTPVETDFVIDATPTVSFTSTPNQDSGDASPSFEFDVNEPGNTAPIDTRCKVDGPDQSGEFSPCTSPFNLTDLNDGIYTLTVKVTDQYGKTSSSSFEWELAIGGVHTFFTQKPPAFSSNADVDFGFESDDPANTFECDLDGGGWAPCVSSVQLLNLGDGQHTFLVRAVTTTDPTVADPTPASWQFTIDTATPTTTVNGTVPVRTNQPVALTFSSNENEATFECSIDGAAFAACATPYTSPVLADGPHTLEVRAVDRAGNEDPAPVSRSWIVDTVAPTTAITAGPAASSLLTTTAANFEFAASETSTLHVKMDGQSWRDCDSSTAQAYQGLADGGHTFMVRATDEAGNVETSPPSRTWSIDATAPVVGIDDGPAGTVKTKGATFKFSSNESNVTFECRLDNGSFSACTSPNAVTAADGDHTFWVRATDAAGNQSEHPATRSWTVDTTAVKPPDKPNPPPVVKPCSFGSDQARCSAPVLRASMKRVGKAKTKKSKIKVKVKTGLTELSAATLKLSRKSRLSLSRLARGKHFTSVVLTKNDGSRPYPS